MAGPIEAPELSPNFNVVNNANGLGVRTLIVTVANKQNPTTSAVSAANAAEFVSKVALASGALGALGANDSDAFTVAGVAGVGVNGGLKVALQGTGTFRVGDDKHVTGLATAIVAEFDQRVIV